MQEACPSPFTLFLFTFHSISLFPFSLSFLHLSLFPYFPSLCLFPLPLFLYSLFPLLSLFISLHSFFPFTLFTSLLFLNSRLFISLHPLSVFFHSLYFPSPKLYLPLPFPPTLNTSSPILPLPTTLRHGSITCRVPSYL